MTRRLSALILEQRKMLAKIARTSAAAAAKLQGQEIPKFERAKVKEEAAPNPLKFSRIDSSDAMGAAFGHSYRDLSFKKTDSPPDFSTKNSETDNFAANNFQKFVENFQDNLFTQFSFEEMATIFDKFDVSEELIAKEGDDEITKIAKYRAILEHLAENFDIDKQPILFDDEEIEEELKLLLPEEIAKQANPEAAAILFGAILQSYLNSIARQTSGNANNLITNLGVRKFLSEAGKNPKMLFDGMASRFFYNIFLIKSSVLGTEYALDRKNPSYSNIFYASFFGSLIESVPGSFLDILSFKSSFVTAILTDIKNEHALKLMLEKARTYGKVEDLVKINEKYLKQIAKNPALRKELEALGVDFTEFNKSQKLSDLAKNILKSDEAILKLFKEEKISTSAKIHNQQGLVAMLEKVRSCDGYAAGNLGNLVRLDKKYLNQIAENSTLRQELEVLGVDFTEFNKSQKLSDLAKNILKSDEAVLKLVKEGKAADNFSSKKAQRLFFPAFKERYPSSMVFTKSALTTFPVALARNWPLYFTAALSTKDFTKSEIFAISLFLAPATVICNMAINDITMDIAAGQKTLEAFRNFIPNIFEQANSQPAEFRSKFLANCLARLFGNFAAFAIFQEKTTTAINDIVYKAILNSLEIYNESFPELSEEEKQEIDEASLKFLQENREFDQFNASNSQETLPEAPPENKVDGNDAEVKKMLSNLLKNFQEMQEFSNVATSVFEESQISASKESSADLTTPSGQVSSPQVKNTENAITVISSY